MKEHYDFSNAEKGKFHRKRHELRIPVYLDEDVEQRLRVSGRLEDETRSQVVNDVLRKAIASSRTE